MPGFERHAHYTGAMAEHVLIDGNNLLHAMHALAPVPHVGRETMVKIIERWAREGDDEVTLVFDGPAPRGGLSKQMASSRIAVRFSAPRTADDVIVGYFAKRGSGAAYRVVSSDTAIGHAARAKKGRVTSAAEFIGELFPEGGSSSGARTSGDGVGGGSPTAEKPSAMSDAERDEWLEIFGDADDGESFPGESAMRG